MNYTLYPKCRTITREQIPIIVELYNSGISIPKIAEQLNIKNYASIVKFLDFNNIRKKPNKEDFLASSAEYTKLDKELVDQMIKDKKTRKEIAEAAGCDFHIIKNYIKHSELSLIDYEQKKYREILLQRKDEVIQLYEKLRNMGEVGKHFNCKGRVITEFFQSIDYNYIHRSNYINLIPYLDKIKQSYYDQNLTLLQISETYGCSSVKIGAFLKANGYKLRDKIDLLRERNSSDEFQKKCISSSGKKKNYILPSGREIFLRGYEPNFLNYVFQNNLLREDDIVYSPKRIRYDFEGKRCYYYPDFYIPKYNLIIEIKSSWIYKKQGIEKNDAKYSATTDMLYNFIMVQDNDFSPFVDFIRTQ